MELRHCPDEYYQNCKNALKLCGLCAAGAGKELGKLHYSPEQDNLCSHPYEACMKQRRKQIKSQEKTAKRGRRSTPNSQNARSGYKSERSTAAKIIRQTQRSGAAFAEGDYKLLDEIDVEHKLRLTRSSFTLRWSEYTKGRARGVSHWLITVDKEGAEHTVAIITLEAYAQLIATIAQLKAEINASQSHPE